MAGSLFITGATGFLGRHFLWSCEQHWDGEIICLSRQAREQSGRARWIQGDLAEPDRYASALGSNTTVVHLAAVTGKADRTTYRQTNSEGTRTLVRVAQTQRIRRFVLVSSIAARYARLDTYPYGASKRDAEQAVSASGLRHLIVRPTIVLGAESPIWQKFRQLAGAPVVPVVGSGRARVQPIHVRDVATALLELVCREEVKGIFELGGAEELSVRELLARIRRAVGASGGVMLPVPYLPLRVVLELMEKGVPRLLPITAGQLAIFVNDGNVPPNSILKAMWPKMLNVDEMIRASVNGDA